MGASSSTTWSRATSPSRRTSRSATPRSTFVATCQRNARSWSAAAFASDPRIGLTCQASSTIPGWPPPRVARRLIEAVAARQTYHTTDTSPRPLPRENRCSLLLLLTIQLPCNKQTTINPWRSEGGGLGQETKRTWTRPAPDDREEREEEKSSPETTLTTPTWIPLKTLFEK